jgi:putative ABC transport system ATP-binding protein
MILLQGVDRIYNAGRPDECAALKDVDLTVAAGELVALSGVSGSGKTTLLSLVGALIKPTRGRIEVAGQSIAKLPDAHASRFRHRTVDFIFQHHNLFPELTVQDNLLAPLVPSQLSSRDEQARIAQALEQAAIAHKAGQTVRDLSGGERQRCAIARALVTNPELILCDEPTAHLDQANTEMFAAILMALKEAGKTVLMATHDPRLEKLKCVDRVVHLAGGKIVDR